MFGIGVERDVEFAVGVGQARERPRLARRAEVVDGDDPDLAGAAALVEGAQDVAPDAPESVDAYIDGSIGNLKLF